ncbi:MAG: YicC family protein [candidate division Zixibacteria bacterium]|nr:YicC family protein [candidate division Zixibacteria bacterium]
MISSMTGYGRAEKNIEDQKVVVELTSVNNRFLEFQIRLPKSLIGLEPKIKKLLSEKLHRGKVNFSLSLEDSQQLNGRMALNTDLADMYFRIFSDLKKRLNLGGEITMEHFIGLSDLITAQNDDVDLDKIWADIMPVCQDALDNFCQMRKAEGKNLHVDFVERVKLIKDNVAQIKVRAANNVEQYRDKLNQRIDEALGDYPVDDQRIAMEVALMAEKMDITEEIIRLGSHLDSFSETLSRTGSIGKRLNFILQEMHREANTIASKSADYETSELVINIKDELEKLREQAMNIE